VVSGQWTAATGQHEISFTVLTNFFLTSIIAQMFADVHILLESHELHELDEEAAGRASSGVLA
jgi:hypothetical protein